MIKKKPLRPKPLKHFIVKVILCSKNYFQDRVWMGTISCPNSYKDYNKTKQNTSTD